MSWCDRNLRMGFAGLGLALILSGCGFQPLYGDSAGRGVTAALNGVEVAPIKGRLGVDIYNHLRDHISPRGLVDGAPDYTLTVSLEKSSVGLITEQNSQFRRFNLLVTAHYRLLVSDTREIAHKGSAVSAASYNVLENSSFATLSAEKDAERQAARDVSNQISLELAVYFDRLGRLGDRSGDDKMNTDTE